MWDKENGTHPTKAAPAKIYVNYITLTGCHFGESWCRHCELHHGCNMSKTRYYSTYYLGQTF